MSVVNTREMFSNVSLSYNALAQSQVLVLLSDIFVFLFCNRIDQNLFYRLYATQCLGVSYSLLAK